MQSSVWSRMIGRQFSPGTLRLNSSRTVGSRTAHRLEKALRAQRNSPASAKRSTRRIAASRRWPCLRSAVRPRTASCNSLATSIYRPRSVNPLRNSRNELSKGLSVSVSVQELSRANCRGRFAPLRLRRYRLKAKPRAIRGPARRDSPARGFPHRENTDPKSGRSLPSVQTAAARTGPALLHEGPLSALHPAATDGACPFPSRTSCTRRV